MVTTSQASEFFLVIAEETVQQLQMKAGRLPSAQALVYKDCCPNLGGKSVVSPVLEDGLY